MHGILLGADGRKMSKSLRNYPDVYEMFDSYGSDAMRWALMSSPVLRGGDMPVTETRSATPYARSLLPLWNAYYFFTLYANAEGYTATARTDSTHLLDRYVLAKTRELVEQTTKSLDEYDISAACAAVRSFLDALTNWYVRRSRDRFWAGDPDAFDTLYTVLETVCRVVAPLAPMVAEEIWRGPDRRALGAPDRLAGRRRVPGRPRPGRVDGLGAGRLLGRAVPAEGSRPAGSAAAGEADRGDAGCRCRCGRSRT